GGVVDHATDQALLETLPVDEPGPVGKPRRAGRGVTLLIVGVVVGVAADRMIVVSSRNLDAPQAHKEAHAAPAPAFSHVGSRIIVPDTSPLRSLLTVSAPAMKDAARTLVLPATVEADPSRTVRVMPPVTGHVTELKVQLGGRVVAGQELAVIDSGDLAQ